MKTIAVIEDNQPIGDLLAEALEGEGYRVERAYSGTEAVYLLERCRPDLILLDLMLPGLSGEELLPRLSGIPVIVVSAKVGIDDKVRLLLGGATDYVTKPFELRELLARVRVHLREPLSRGEDRLRAGEICLDLVSHSASVGGRPVHLTRTEYAVLRPSRVKIRHSGLYCRRHAGLHRKFPETACEQPPAQIARSRRSGMYPGRVGHRFRFGKILTNSLLFS